MAHPRLHPRLYPAFTFTDEKLAELKARGVRGLCQWIDV